MPDRVHVDESRDLIEIQSFGVVTKADIAASIATIRELAESNNIDRILVDTTMQEEMPSTTEIYELFSEFPRRTRTALLSDESQPTSEDLAFVESVSVNRGTQMKVFFKKEEALAWLGLD